MCFQASVVCCRNENQDCAAHQEETDIRERLSQRSLRRSKRNPFPTSKADKTKTSAPMARLALVVVFCSLHVSAVPTSDTKARHNPQVLIGLSADHPNAAPLASILIPTIERDNPETCRRERKDTVNSKRKFPIHGKPSHDSHLNLSLVQFHHLKAART